MIFIKDLVNAQHQSIYIPNYLQAFDYPNLDETPSPFQQQEHADDRFNDDFDPFQFDFFQTSTIPSIQFLSETSTIVDTDNSTTNLTSTILTSTDSTTEFISTTEQTTSIENSTYSYVTNDTNETSPSNEIITSSTVNNTLFLLSSTSNYSIENKSFSIDEQINETTENIFNDNSTIATFFTNNTDLIMNLLNRTEFHSKNLINNKQFDIYNTTAEEAARHLTDRKTMQSLIHLLPPNLWSQLQKNFSFINFTQNQYMQPSLPDPVVLAEAAAQAGLPGPGPYPIPDYLWHQNSNYYRNPSQIINNNPISTCELIFCFSIK
jgi:hypothetical protein